MNIALWIVQILLALAFALASRVMFILADLITTALVQPLGHFVH